MVIYGWLAGHLIVQIKPVDDIYGASRTNLLTTFRELSPTVFLFPPPTVVSAKTSADLPRAFREQPPSLQKVEARCSATRP